MTTKKKKRNITADKQTEATNQSRCGFVWKSHKSDKKQNAVITGFVTMRISTSCFHLRGTVASGITVDTPFADTTILKDMMETGRIVRNAEKTLKRKCTFTLGQMNTILKSWKTLQTMNPLNVQSVEF